MRSENLYKIHKNKVVSGISLVILIVAVLLSNVLNTFAAPNYSSQDYSSFTTFKNGWVYLKLVDGDGNYKKYKLKLEWYNTAWSTWSESDCIDSYNANTGQSGRRVNWSIDSTEGSGAITMALRGDQYANTEDNSNLGSGAESTHNVYLSIPITITVPAYYHFDGISNVSGTDYPGKLFRLTSNKAQTDQYGLTSGDNKTTSTTFNAFFIFNVRYHGLCTCNDTDTRYWNSTYTAKWAHNVYSLTLNNQNATSAGTANIYEKHSVGYFLDSGCTAEKKMTASANAITKPERKYTITYNHNYTDSTNTTDTATYTFGGYYTGTGGSDTEVIKNTGYINTSLSTTDFTSGSTIYAKWTGGSITLPTPTRPGYTLSGWYSESNCLTKIGDGGDSYTPTATKTLYAKWTITSYTITYELNGGTHGTTHPDTYTINTDTFTISRPTKSNYEFTGWTVYPAPTSWGTGSTSSGQDIKVAKGTYGNFTLTANWNQNAFTLTANAHGGSIPATSGWTGTGSTATKTVTTGATYGTLPTPIRDYYDFAGWYTEETGGSRVYTTTTMGSANTTIHAHWTPTEYTITYSLNGGTQVNPKASYNIETQTFTLVNPTKDGYDFKGWTGSNGSTAQTSVSISQGSHGNKSYTANWTAKSYTIILNPNGGTVSSTSVTVTMDSNVGNTVPTASRRPTATENTGFVFQGWYTTASGTGDKVYDANGNCTTEGGYWTNIPTTGKWQHAGNVTLYARWQTRPLQTYTITFKTNDGTNTTFATQTKTEYRDLTLTTSKPTWYRHKFLNVWTTGSDGSGTSYAPGDTYNVDASVTLYAKWRDSYTYTVHYDGNMSGATPSNVPGNQTKWEDEDLTLSSTIPELDGYTFEKWNTNQDGTGADYNPSMNNNTGEYTNPSVYTTNAALTLYAIWTEDPSSSSVIGCRVLFGVGQLSGTPAGGTTSAVTNNNNGYFANVKGEGYRYELFNNYSYQGVKLMTNERYHLRSISFKPNGKYYGYHFVETNGKIDHYNRH